MAGKNRVSFRADDGRQIEANAIDVVLPDGNVFRISAEPGRNGAATLTLDAGTPEAPSLRVFGLEPGAANLVFVRVLQTETKRD